MHIDDLAMSDEYDVWLAGKIGFVKSVPVT